MSQWNYYPIEKRLRVRCHKKTGKLQCQTIGSGLRGWRNVSPGRGAPLTMPEARALALHWRHGAGAGAAPVWGAAG